MSVGGQQQGYHFLVNTLPFSILQPSSKYILLLKECLWEQSREASARNTTGQASCCIRAVNLASSSVAYTLTQNRITVFKICQKENIYWEILFSEVHLSPFHLSRKEKSLARPQLQIAMRASVCVCVYVCVCVCKVLFIFFKSVFPLDVERPCTIGKLMLYIFSFIWKTLALTFAKRYHLIFQTHIHFYYLSVFCLLVCISLFASCLFLCVLISFKLTVCRYVVNNCSFCS